MLRQSQQNDANFFIKAYPSLPEQKGNRPLPWIKLELQTRVEMQALTLYLGVRVVPKLETGEFNTHLDTVNMTLSSPRMKMRIGSKIH